MHRSLVHPKLHTSLLDTFLLKCLSMQKAWHNAVYTLKTVQNLSVKRWTLHSLKQTSILLMEWKWRNGISMLQTLLAWCTPRYGGTFQAGIKVVVCFWFMCDKVLTVFTICLQFDTRKIEENEEVVVKRRLSLLVQSAKTAVKAPPMSKLVHHTASALHWSVLTEEFNLGHSFSETRTVSLGTWALSVFAFDSWPTIKYLFRPLQGR